MILAASFHFASSQSLWERFGTQVLIVAIILVAAGVTGFVGRWLILVLTRGIETGMPIGERSARKALRRAKLLKVPGEPTLEERLEEQRRLKRSGTVRAVLNSALTVLVLATTVMSLLTYFGVPVGPLIASAGIVGVALGFGAQSLVKDLLSGLFMLIEDQYGVGDIIDVGPASGVVEEVGLRAVRLRSLDGTVWYVPNGEIQRVGSDQPLRVGGHFVDQVAQAGTVMAVQVGAAVGRYRNTDGTRQRRATGQGNRQGIVFLGLAPEYAHGEFHGVQPDADVFTIFLAVRAAQSGLQIGYGDARQRLHGQRLAQTFDQHFDQGAHLDVG